MDNKEIEVNVEQIMNDIRKQIRLENKTIDIPSFDSVPAAGINFEANATQQSNWDALLDALDFINMNYEIPYYWDFGPRSIKSFLKRIVRKLVKCIVFPILEKQIDFNAHTALSLNASRYLMEEELASTKELQEEIKSLKASMREVQEEIKSFKTEAASEQ